MPSNPDLLTGTSHLSQHASYNVVCPIFDARPGVGNYVGADITEAMQNPYSEPGFVRVVNMITAQYYFLDRHYSQEGFEPPPGEARGNWLQLRSRVEGMLGLRSPLDLHIVEKITAFVRLSLGTNGESEPDARRYWVSISTSRNQLFTPETDARLVAAVLQTKGKDFALWRSAHQPRRIRELLEKRVSE